MIAVVRNGEGLGAEIRNVFIVMAKDTNEASEWVVTWEYANDPHWPYKDGRINIFSGLEFDGNIDHPDTVFDARHDCFGQEVSQMVRFLNRQEPDNIFMDRGYQPDIDQMEADGKIKPVSKYSD